MNESKVRETKERILDAAERLLAQQGIPATSLRQITAEAGVNLAAVNYHFQSKDELTRQVYTRRLRPMNAERLRRLNELETGEHSLDELLDAFYGPVLDTAMALRERGVTIGQFLGRIYTEPHAVVEQIWSSEMAEVANRYLQAFGRALPHLQPVEAMWRMTLTIGVLAHTLAAEEKISRLSLGQLNLGDRAEVLRQLKQYAKAGLMAASLEG
ncbi:TetR/AcrR family transcriptional regulator [Bryobacter aggregatus]|uniref:TetR/AcrR family transcriptional regulator n=1 Tax=Bryobacter aggregatus TaxID=360054 RepID=UPI00068DF71D|nr:TetR/AcrR family transcriptional regulator [Bryobacter aggregatus]